MHILLKNMLWILIDRPYCRLRSFQTKKTCFCYFFLNRLWPKKTKGWKPRRKQYQRGSNPTWTGYCILKILFCFGFLHIIVKLHLRKHEKLVSHNKHITFCWIWSKLLQNCSQSSLQFKDQVVREVVDRMCSEFSGQCCTHRASDPPAEEPSTSGTQKATSSTTLRASSSTPNCSICKGPATGGGYQCRWECPKTCLTNDTL